MEDVLTFLENNELLIYLIGGAVGLFYLFRLFISWREWRGTLFGLERESAQRRFSQNMTVVILIALFMMAAFILVSLVSPTLPQTSALPTPTLDLVSTPTPPPVGPGTEIAPTQQVLALSTVEVGQCEPGRLEWIEPQPGGEISGTVELIGTVNIEDFGFYKYEYSSPDGSNWSTIAAGNQPVVNGKLGDWNTSQMLPGDYLLRLVAVNNQNQALPSCVVQVRIFTPSE
ncbi:MAG TPA: hypothetical protein VIO36_08245 [Anaerolineaceae bacterium]